jgi:ABC-2 type transport system ATP-binding protein
MIDNNHQSITIDDLREEALVVPVIEAWNLTKRFGRTEALAGLDLLIEPGAVVALLGPNGAGKTTFVRAVATLLQADGGDLRVYGHDVVRASRQVRSCIGLAGQHAAVEETMTGAENLEMVGRLYGFGRADARLRARAVIEQLTLDEVADRLVRTYSGGERRRLDLGASLVGSPRLLLLDEPTTGLDPRSRIELWDAVRMLAADGTDVLLTTQYLDEADQLAARVVIIDHGRVIADGTPDELKRRAGHDVIDVRVRDATALASAARALRAVGGDDVTVDADGRRISLPVGGGTEPLVAAACALDAAGVVADDVTLRRPTLDEVFLTLTARTLDTTDSGDPERRSA